MNESCMHDKIGSYWIGQYRVCYNCFVAEIRRRAEKKIQDAAWGGRLEVNNERD